MMISVTGEWSLMKFELIRDFFQILNLYCSGFVSADAYNGVMAFFGSLGGIVSLDVSFFEYEFNLDFGLSQH